MTIHSANEFASLLSSDSPDDRQRVMYEEASASVWLDILESYPDCAFDVAHNKTVPVEVLAVLATNPDSRVRFMVARKRKLTPEILDALAGDPNDGVRASVARHHRTPQNVLDRLRSDPSEIVRRELEQRL